ncbi:MAG TPA: hypothetical protein VES40_13780 [Ilumatobacteraceae bacterium]|nr:hypothetical protein [Ilumatobacteraceae bacterium]
MSNEPNPHIEPLVDELIQQSPDDENDTEVIRGIVTELVSEFDGAPIQGFVDILVFKGATEELADLHASPPVAP